MSDPIREAINLGGGQTCNIEGVLRELHRAGYVIVPIEPTEAMCRAGAKYYHDNFREGHAKEDTSMKWIWEKMTQAAHTPM